MNASSESKTVLAVTAHPDDIAFFCAGTLALLRRDGWKVVVASMTPGQAGASDLLPDEFARVCIERARSAAAVLDAEYHCLESLQFTIFFSDAPCRHVTGLVRALDPNLVLTHSSMDRVAHREETSRIVRQACSSAPAEDYVVEDVPGGQTPTSRAPHLYYFDPSGGVDLFGRPVKTAWVVDIADVIETKTQFVADVTGCVAGTPAADSPVERMRTWSQERGRSAGCAFGEGFRLHEGQAFPGDNLLGAALGSLMHAAR